MKPYDSIVVAPFGVLYYVPFHALIREEGGKQEYLIERKRISYTTSATFTDLLKDQRMKLDKLMAFGNPDGSLPGASEEVRKIKDDIVHLATHGLIQKNPLESYLLFAGDSENEKRLTLLEIAGYTALRERTALVFLSACQTAMESARGSGSEMISLAEAFAMAGPPTLIATLWEVEDISTSHLVSHFYGELRNSKLDKLEALRSAQLALLKSSQFSEPYFWAPFIMIENWR